MAKSALMLSLQRAYRIAQALIKTGIPADELSDFGTKKPRVAAFFMAVWD